MKEYISTICYNVVIWDIDEDKMKSEESFDSKEQAEDFIKSELDKLNDWEKPRFNATIEPFEDIRED